MNQDQEERESSRSIEYPKSKMMQKTNQEKKRGRRGDLVVQEEESERDDRDGMGICRGQWELWKGQLNGMGREVYSKAGAVGSGKVVKKKNSAGRNERRSGSRSRS